MASPWPHSMSMASSRLWIPNPSFFPCHLSVSLRPKASDSVGSTSRSLFSGSPVVDGPSQLSEGPFLF